VTCKRAHADNPSLRYFRRLASVLGTILLASLPCYSTRAAACDLHKHYALIFGTVWGPDDRPVYGVKVLIRRADQKKPKWELYSNHTGEFAQRLPAGPADYVIRAEAKSVKAISNNKLHPGSEVTVHIVAEERVDVGLHLN
jgi:hypothetical protein